MFVFSSVANMKHISDTRDHIVFTSHLKYYQCTWYIVIYYDKFIYPLLLEDPCKCISIELILMHPSPLVLFSIISSMKRSIYSEWHFKCLIKVPSSFKVKENVLTSTRVLDNSEGGSSLSASFTFAAFPECCSVSVSKPGCFMRQYHILLFTNLKLMEVHIQPVARILSVL